VRVLLTRLSAFGDIVHTWPLADAIGRHPDHPELAWLVEERFLPLVTGHPAVARAIPVATRRWCRHPFAAATRAEICAVRRQVRAFAPDLVLDPQGLVKSALWVGATGAPRRVGLHRNVRRERLAGLFYNETVRPPDGIRHVVDINLALLSALGMGPPFGATPDALFMRAAALASPAAFHGAVALLPTSAGAGKAWPAASFAALARELIRSGRSPVVIWGPSEHALAQEICAAAGAGAMLAPPTSLAELAGLLAACSAAVGGDSGPVHLAAALGVPTVAVFLTTDPERNGPRGPRVRIVSGARGGATRGRARTAGAAAVPVADVLAALDTGLQRAPDAPA